MHNNLLIIIINCRNKIMKGERKDIYYREIYNINNK